MLKAYAVVKDHLEEEASSFSPLICQDVGQSTQLVCVVFKIQPLNINYRADSGVMIYIRVSKEVSMSMQPLIRKCMGHTNMT